jgi:hypothetical protein
MALLPGFINLQDKMKERIIQPAIQELVNTAFEQSLEVYNTETNQALALFSQEVNVPSIRYKSPVAGFLQALDEHGRARPIKMAGHYDVSFPIYKAGRAFGMTRDALIRMTVQESNDNLSLMLDADRRWVRRQLLASLFGKSNRTFLDEEYGSLTVLPIANGDSQTYLIREGDVAGATANHQVAQTGAIAASNFPVIYEALTHRPENGTDGEVIVFLNSTDAATVTAMNEFIEADDPDILRGITSDRLVGSLDASVPGRIWGKIARCWIVQWNAIPANYLLAVNTSGNRALGLRQPLESELRGFKAVAERNDHPYFERQFERRLGFGAYNRVNAYILQFNGGDTTYDVPTGFDPSVLV